MLYHGSQCRPLESSHLTPDAFPNAANQLFHVEHLKPRDTHPGFHAKPITCATFRSFHGISYKYLIIDNFS